LHTYRTSVHLSFSPGQIISTNTTTGHPFPTLKFDRFTQETFIGLAALFQTALATE